MTERETECTNWATDEYDGKGYCGQHYGSRVNAGIAAEREASRQAEMQKRIEEFIAWKADHPSVWDSFAIMVTTVGQPVPKGMIWSARSGLPAPKR